MDSTNLGQEMFFDLLDEYSKGALLMLFVLFSELIQIN
jgi:hypothetical protein